MNVELRLGPEDLTRCRFAVSPLHEARSAVATLVTPSRRAMHVPWMRRVLAEARQLDLSPLVALMPRSGYVPDFLAPPPDSPVGDVADELARLRATPPEQVAREIAESIESAGSTDGAATARKLLIDPATARDRLADLLERCWEVLVRPFWPSIRDLLEADIHYRARRMSRDGLAGLFDDLHPDVDWRRGRLRVRKRHTDVRDLRGEGVVLMPSAFNWPDVTVIVDLPWQPTVIYPARGIADLWQVPGDAPVAALADLLGRTRAELLLALAESGTTTGLARRHRLSNSVVSMHLGALRAAGLARSHRSGREVRYELTPLGQALIGAAARS